MKKIICILILLFCYKAYAETKSFIIIPIRTDYKFVECNLKKDILRLKKIDIDLLPTYIFKSLPLKVKFSAGYSRLDPNKQLFFNMYNFYNPFDGGIMLIKFKFIL